MTDKTFLVSSTKEFAERLTMAIGDYDIGHGFKVKATGQAERKQMTILSVQLVDGTVFDIMIEMR